MTWWGDVRRRMGCCGRGWQLGIERLRWRLAVTLAGHAMFHVSASIAREYIHPSASAHRGEGERGRGGTPGLRQTDPLVT
jgi:hypothetical protein